MPRNPASHDRRQRVEPVLGTPSPRAQHGTDDHFARSALPRRSSTRRKPPWWLWGLGLVLLLLAIGTVVFREQLGAQFWPQPRAQTLLQQAETALREGHLSDADGSGARQLYEAALALHPDRSQAREGLVRVGQAALARARTATEQRRFAEAHRALQLARELRVPRDQVQAVAERLRQREAAAAGIDQLLADAADALQAGRLDDGSDTALPLYRRVLALQPDNQTALAGRDDALAALLQQAEEALQQDDLVAAADRIRRARNYHPAHAGLLDAQAHLLQAADARRQEADYDLRNGRLDRALAGYRAVYSVDPGDAAAERGIKQVAVAWARRAERLAGDFRLAPALAALDKARKIAPELNAVRAAELRIERARRSKSRLPPAVSGAAQSRQLEALLAQAQAARRRGDLLAPPGDSAFDKLRNARAIAPDDARVAAVSRELLAAFVRCFDDALRGNSLTRAGQCLDARRQLGEGQDALQAARVRLAQRWIAVGGQRLGAGDLAFARRALETARQLDPAAPGLAEFAARVGDAAAAVD